MEADHKEAIRTVELSSLDSLHDRVTRTGSLYWLSPGEQWKKKALADIAALDPGEEDDESTETVLLMALRAIFKKGFAEYRKKHLIAMERIAVAVL